MKKIEKVTLINWHYISYETMELKDVNFLTGKNGSGKTTIIDAFQVLLLADTTGHYFNKSASDKSSRTLKGYLRCEIGDGENGMQYLRNGRFTSYVTATVHDEKNDRRFTIGAAFDTYETGDYDTKFFIYDGVLDEKELLKGKAAISSKELKAHLFEKGGPNCVTFYDTNISYKEDLKVKLGNLNNNFFTLFKKSVPFTPISDIEKFITEYICDVKYQIDITSMQENIRAYKQLELEADVLRRRVDELSMINTAYDDWHNDETKLRLQKYMLNRLDLMVKEKQIDVYKEQIESNKEDIAYSKNLISKNAAEIAQLSVEKEKLLEEKFSSDAYKQRAALEDQEKQLKNQIDSLDYKVDNLRDSFAGYYGKWNAAINAVNNYKSDDEYFGELQAITKKLAPSINLFSINSNDLTRVDRKDYLALQESLDDLKNDAAGLIREYESAGKEAYKTREGLLGTINTLNSGVKVYDSRLLKLRELIKEGLRNKYKKEINVEILADLLEIKDRRWANAIEGYLSNQKFYLFVAPEYVNDAISIYDKAKFEYNLFGYGIVDTGRILEKKHEVFKGALSEELTTDNKYARAFVDMTLGNMMKCDKVEELRQYNRAITDSGMLYQGYVASQINKERWAHPFIGNNAIKAQVEEARAQIKEAESSMVSLKERIDLLRALVNCENINNYQVESLVSIAGEVKELPSLKEQHALLLDSISSLDSSYIFVLNNKLENVTRKLEMLNADKEDIIANVSKLEADNERIRDEILPNQEKEISEAKAKINSSFTRDWVNSVGEPTFIGEISQKQDIDRLFKVYQQEISVLDNGLSRKFNKVVNLRSNYVTTYKLGYDVNDISNKMFQDEYDELSTNKLGEYKEKIAKAKDNAMIQFKNDFLSKLKGNFDTVELQINNLNEALEDSTFGNDSYHFTMAPRSEYREYYDMINDPMLVEGETLFSDAFNEKYGETIENLFRQITYVDDELSANMKGEIAKNIEKFTDYRTYLKFDLIVKDEAGRKQFLSKTLLKKSGGETQTPFYISILASFAQLYRVSDKNSNDPGTIRLIIFDEAFSKMDSERIQESVKLLRHYGLQAILSAPPEKMSDIVPLVDQTLCVIRDSSKAMIRAYHKA